MMKSQQLREKKTLRPFCCPNALCTQRFQNQRDLISHLRGHRGHRQFKCCEPNCLKSFDTHSCLKKHERIHKGEKPFKCEICGQSFSQISNLRRHIRVHKGERPYECTICHKKFSTSSNHKQHMMVHQEKNDRQKFWCQECQTSYYYKASLKKHMKSYHGANSTTNNSPSKSKTEEELQQISKKVFITPTTNIIIPEFSYQEMFQRQKELVEFWESNTQAYFKSNSISNMTSWLCPQLALNSRKTSAASKDEDGTHNELWRQGSGESPDTKTENVTEKSDCNHSSSIATKVNETQSTPTGKHLIVTSMESTFGAGIIIPIPIRPLKY